METPDGRRVEIPTPTRRRSVLAATAGMVPLAGCLTLDGDDDPSADGTGRPADPEPPFEVRTVDAPGSEAGSITIPEPGTVTACNFTRTECPTSEAYLETVADAKARIDDERVRFVSIIEYGRDPTETDEAFAEWWTEHDGDWTLAIDDERAVFGHYGVDGTPQMAVIGGDGTVFRQESGGSAGDIVRAVDEALAATDDGD